MMTKTVYMLYSDSMHGGIYAATGFTVTPGTCPTVCFWHGLAKYMAKRAKSGENWAEMPLLFNVIIFAVPADSGPWPTLALTWC